MDEKLILDRYRLIERLASGGSAEVWRAHDEQLDRPVAVKRLHPHLLPDAASRARLVAEARAVAGLSHPAIVGVYDVDAEGESPALVMELVDGESLSARIARDGPLAPREAAAVTAELADALYHAHQRGVIHRDVKPGNVLLSRDGRTRLVDFGIAHSLAASSERLTVTGTVIGTLSAMAPEQLAAGRISPKTDLYGLGAVLHEALTGRPPYDAPTAVALADAQRAGPPDLTGIEPGLAAILAACLARDPGDRPLHAGALATALRAWLDGDARPALALAPPPPLDAATTTTMARPSVVPAVPAVAAAVPAAPGAARRDGGRVRSWPLLLVAALAILLLAAGFVLSGMTRDGGGIGDEPLPTATPTVTAAVTPTIAPPTPPPWLAEVLAKVTEECGADVAAQAEAELAALSEEQAKDVAKELEEACKEAADEGGGGDDGGGNGDGGRGNGNEGNGGRGGGD